jgi:hypothetical protein
MPADSPSYIGAISATLVRLHKLLKGLADDEKSQNYPMRVILIFATLVDLKVLVEGTHQGPLQRDVMMGFLKAVTLVEKAPWKRNEDDNGWAFTKEFKSYILAMAERSGLEYLEDTLSLLSGTLYLDSLGRIAATSEDPPSKATSHPIPIDPPPFVLGDRDVRQPIVNGVRQRRLTEAQFDVMKAVRDAAPDVLTKEGLIDKSGHQDAVGVLRRLLHDEPVYRTLMALSGRERKGYRWIGKIDAEVDA